MTISNFCGLLRISELHFLIVFRKLEQAVLGFPIFWEIVKGCVIYCGLFRLSNVYISTRHDTRLRRSVKNYSSRLLQNWSFKAANLLQLNRFYWCYLENYYFNIVNIWFLCGNKKFDLLLVLATNKRSF